MFCDVDTTLMIITSNHNYCYFIQENVEIELGWGFWKFVIERLKEEQLDILISFIKGEDCVVVFSNQIWTVFALQGRQNNWNMNSTK